MTLIIAILDFLKAAIWPAFFGWLILRYGADLKAAAGPVMEHLLPRLKKASATGFEFDTTAAVGQQEAPRLPAPADLPEHPTPAQSGTLKEFPGEGRTSAMAEVERNLHSSLTALVASGKIHESDKVDYLIKELAMTRLIAHFVRVYSLIFGSQLVGLRVLKERRTATMDDAKELFNSARNADPEFYRDYKFEAWLSFLKDNWLIAIDDDNITLTPTGDDFLQYVFSQGLRTDRRG